MKKLFFFVLLAVMTVAVKAQILYRITPTDSTAKPSYVVATMKFLNPLGIIDPDDSVKAAIQHTDRMAFLTHPDADSVNILNAARELPAGKNIRQFLSADELKSLNTILKAYEGIGIDNPAIQKVYGGLTPVALADKLDQLIFVANHMGEYDPTHTFDQWFKAQAQKNQMGMYGLCPVRRMAQKLEDMSASEQMAVLRPILNDYQARLAQLDKAVSAYKLRDLGGVANALNGTSSVCPSVGCMPTMAEKVKNMSIQKPTLFILDAAIVGGNHGLLKALADAGVKIQAVE
ncbi:MAG: TraB/GumN family protein [Prevotellaceae bacterium]|nr:TraB/GumN family protein [Prevotellaceae bacterium]